MDPYRLQTRCLPEGARALTSLLRPMQSQQATRLHATGTTRVEWYCITQLVVRREYRELRPATTLLSMLDGGGDVFGIMGSQPAACKALANAFRGDLPRSAGLCAKRSRQGPGGLLGPDGSGTV